jgi:ABC-type bacteriocin/lantibiotic exporter with double-glycine peptidase domain
MIPETPIFTGFKPIFYKGCSKLTLGIMDIRMMPAHNIATKRFNYNLEQLKNLIIKRHMLAGTTGHLAGFLTAGLSIFILWLGAERVWNGNLDKIIVLQNGEIVEEGNHQGLVIKEGVYTKLFRDQILEKVTIL